MKRSADQPVEAAGGGQARHWLELPDAELLGQCAIDLYRASGPGGQKRNKTSSAVRLRHALTGLIVTATESRSQHENRARALRRLRQAIALNERNPIDPAAGPPAFFSAALERDRTLRVNRRHADHLRIVQYVLDVLFACEARVGRAAGVLGISTGHLVRFLENDAKAWACANRLRKEFGHQPLKPTSG